jgi:signal peptidase I
MGVAVCNVATGILPYAFLLLRPEWAENVAEAIALAACIVLFLVLVGIVSAVFRTSAWRAVGIVLVATAASAAIGYTIALGVRATLVELFVIPTGSMAPTVLGEHGLHTCPNCGREFAVHSVPRLPGERVPAMDDDTRCGTCGKTFHVPAGASHAGGDRIAVDKTVEVDRWDLAVFRKPDEPELNYLKRVIGLPGETIDWHAGEVFADGSFLRKPPGTMESLWFPVSDTAFIPKEPGERKWIPDGGEPGWRQDGDGWRGMAAKEATARLRFDGNIESSYEYNGDERHTPIVKVTDVMVRLTTANAPLGTLAVNWKFAGIGIAFEVDEESSALKILQTEPVGRELAAEPFPELALKLEPIEFAIRDGQAYVRRAGAVIASAEFGPSTLAEHRAQFARARTRKERCEIALAIRGGSAHVGRIELFRDVYYLSPADLKLRGPDVYAQANRPVVLGDDEYWMLGDNSAAAQDARFWGPVTKDALIGVAKWIYWPPKRARTLE